MIELTDLNTKQLISKMQTDEKGNWPSAVGPLESTLRRVEKALASGLVDAF